MSLLRPDLMEHALRDARPAPGGAHEFLHSLEGAVAWTDDLLQAGRSEQLRELRGGGGQPYRGILGAVALPALADGAPEPVLSNAQGNAALARLADRLQPAGILLLIDQVLRAVFSSGKLDADSMWVVGLLSNSLGVLAALQAPPAATYVYMEAAMRKAARYNITLSALALKLYRNELLQPLLEVPPPLDVAARRTPVWRVHLGSVVALSQWHGYESLLLYADALADEAATAAWGLAPGACCTPLRRVNRVAEHVLDWWRQPMAQRILNRVSEKTLWHAFFSGGATPEEAGARDTAAVAQMLTDVIGSEALARPGPMHVERSDVVPAALTFKVVLARQGCLATDHAAWRRAHSPLSSLYTLTPGCPGLVRFMQTPPGRAAFMRPYSRETGVLGACSRAAARAVLLNRGVRDAMVRGAGGAAEFACGGVRRVLRAFAARGGARGEVAAQTLVEWMADTDPWTVIGTSIAAMLAVLRVVMRLTSTFTSSSGYTATALPAPPALPAADGPPPRAATPPPTPPPAGGRKGRKGAKGGAAAARAKRGGTSSDSAGASAVNPAAAPPPPPSMPRSIDALRHAAAPPGGAASWAGVLPSVRSLAAACSLHSRLAEFDPELAASISAALPPMFRGAPDAAVDAAKRPRMSGRHAAALAQLQVMHQMTSLKAAKPGDAMLPFSLSRPDDFIASGDDEIQPAGAQAAPPLIVVSEADSDARPDAASEAPSPQQPAPDQQRRPGLAADAAEQELSARLQLFRRDECGSVPELFLCPISRELMDNPVLASDGHIYEKTQIESWLRTHCTSPMTNMTMRPEVAPVLTLRSEIQDFRARYPHLL